MANVRFAVLMGRMVPFLGYHHGLMILIAFGVILLCTSAVAPSSIHSAMNTY